MFFFVSLFLLFDYLFFAAVAEQGSDVELSKELLDEICPRQLSSSSYKSLRDKSKRKNGSTSMLSPQLSTNTTAPFTSPSLTSPTNSSGRDRASSVSSSTSYRYMM